MKKFSITLYTKTKRDFTFDAEAETKEDAVNTLLLVLGATSEYVTCPKDTFGVKVSEIESFRVRENLA